MKFIFIDTIVLGLSAVDRGFESRSGQTKDYKLVFVAYNTKHAVLRRKNKTFRAFTILRKIRKKRLFEYMYINKFIFCHLPHSVGNL
jgi:hypothetical protein